MCVCVCVEQTGLSNLGYANGLPKRLENSKKLKDVVLENLWHTSVPYISYQLIQKVCLSDTNLHHY